MEIKKISFNEKTKKSILIVALIITGLAFIIISSLPEAKETKAEKSRLDCYIEDTEKRLCETLSRIKGTGYTKVFISTSNTFESVYASNAVVNQTETGKNTEKSLVPSCTDKLLRGLGNLARKYQVAVQSHLSENKNEIEWVKELCPDIAGVLIVCEGGSNSYIKEEIIKSVSTALGISSNKIHVTGGTDK